MRTAPLQDPDSLKAHLTIPVCVCVPVRVRARVSERQVCKPLYPVLCLKESDR